MKCVELTVRCCFVPTQVDKLQLSCKIVGQGQRKANPRLIRRRPIFQLIRQQLQHLVLYALLVLSLPSLVALDELDEGV
jgi:hypothetical protein